MDIDSLKNELKNLREQKEKLFTQQKELSGKIGQLIATLKEHKKTRDELTSKVHEGKKKRDEINEEIRKLIDEVKKIQGPSDAPRGVSPGRLKKEIDSIQRTIETAAVSFDKEKELMKKLREKQKVLDQFGAKAQNKSQVAEIDKELKKLKKDSDDVHDVVQASAKASQDNHESMLKLSKEIDGLREEETKLREEIAPLKEQIKEKSKALDKYYEDNNIEKPKRSPKPRSMKPRVDKEAVAEVNEKIRTGAKLTTEDLLILQQTDE